MVVVLRGVKLAFLEGFCFVVVFINATLLGAFSGGTVIQFCRFCIRIMPVVISH